MFPSFDPADVLHAQVARARVAEPVHVAGRPAPRARGRLRGAGPGRRVLGRASTPTSSTARPSSAWPSAWPRGCRPASARPPRRRRPREHRARPRRPDRDARPAGRHGTGARAARPGAERRPRRRPGAGDRRRAAGRDHVEPVGRPVLRHRARPRRRAPRSRTPTCPTWTSLLVRAARRRCCWASSSRSPGSRMGPAVGLGLVLAAACIGLTYAVGPPAAAAAAGGARRRARGRAGAVEHEHLLRPAAHARRAARRAAWRSSRCSPPRATRRPAPRRWVAATGACLGLCLLTKPESAIALGAGARRLARRRAAVVAGADGRRRARSATSPWPSGLPCSSGSAGTRPSSSRARWSTTRSRSARSSTATSSRPGCCASRSPSSTTCWPRARRRASSGSPPISRCTWRGRRRSSRSG